MITQKIIARADSLKLDKIISRYGEDSMRQVVFIIVRPDPDSEELIPITIPEDAIGSFRILKPSGNFVIVPMSKSVLATGETAFDVVIPASANTAKGSGYYDIRITSDTDKYYFTAQGDFLIDDNIISDEALEDVSEVNGLVFPDDFLTTDDHVAIIDDDSISTDTTWSSDKISEEIEAHAGGDVSKTVSGNPVTFEDGATAPLVKCVTEIQGSQDLHGYDKPWVGGAGKNKLPMTVDGMKTANIDGTWNGNAYTTTNGIACKVNTDNGGNVISITCTGTASGGPAQSFRVCDLFSFSSDTSVILSGSDNIGTVGHGLYVRDYTSAEDITTANFTMLANHQYRILFLFNSNGNYNVTLYPMLRLSTETDPTYAPYSNICPITAYTEGEIEVSDGDGNTTTHTTTFPDAIYRGSEDVVNGSATCNWPVIDLGDLTWYKSGSMFYSEGVTDFKRGTPYNNRYYANAICSHYAYGVNDDPDATITLYYDSASSLYRLWVNDPTKASMTTADFKTAMSGVQFAYQLATPTTSSVTPTNLPIKSLYGYNHIESSTGDMELEYIIQRYQPLIDSIKQL